MANLFLDLAGSLKHQSRLEVLTVVW